MTVSFKLVILKVTLKSRILEIPLRRMQMRRSCEVPPSLHASFTACLGLENKDEMLAFHHLF